MLVRFEKSNMLALCVWLCFSVARTSCACCENDVSVGFVARFSENPKNVKKSVFMHHC